MPRAVGLDVGSRTLKLVELSGSPKAFKVQRVIVAPLPEGEGSEEARVELIRKVFADGHFGKDDVCASFDAGSTVFREISLPYRDDEKIENTVRYEAENHLHGRAIEDVVVNWVRIGETKEGSQILVMAAPKADLASDLAILRRAGIEPASVDLDATALYTACEACGVFREHPDVLVIEVGARTTSLLIVSGGRLKAVRSFLVGSETVVSGIQHDLELPPGAAAAAAQRGRAPDPGDLLVPAASLSPSDAESSKSVAELEGDTAAARREDFVRKLQREVTRSIASARAASAPDCILLAGGGSLMPELKDSLAERMGTRVEPLNILSRMGYHSAAPSPALEEAMSAVAAGCALRILGSDPLGVELRQEEFAPSNTFEVVRTALWIGMTLLVALLVGFYWMQREGLESEQRRYNAGVGSKAATIFDEAEKNYQISVKNKGDKEAREIAKKARLDIPSDDGYLLGIRAHLQRRYRELENDLGLSKDVPRIESATKVWLEIAKALDTIPRPDLGYFRINKIAITQQLATITIEIDSEGTVDKVLEALQKSEYLRGRAKNPVSVSQHGSFNKNPQSQRFNGVIEIPFGDEGN